MLWQAESRCLSNGLNIYYFTCIFAPGNVSDAKFTDTEAEVLAMAQSATNGQTSDLAADVVVIGSGAAGLPAAIKAADGGASVIVVETNYDIGGHAMDGLEIVQASYVFRRRLKGFDGTIPLQCYVALIAWFFQQLRCAHQGFIDLVLGQLRHVFVNTDFQ